MESSGNAPEEQVPQKSPSELFPYVEDWIALQGGRPRVFHNPDRPDSAWLVVHVYEEHPDVKKRFASGLIVPTKPPVEGQSVQRRGFWRHDENGKLVFRDFEVPSFMDRGVHGDVCAKRSEAQGGDTYERIKNQVQYEDKLGELRQRGFVELRFSLRNGNYAMLPLPAIRPPKPLG